ncbi:mitochondrial 54S ribosomal protein uL4m [Dipodascopsis tothii]|uniref:mitochondrial 54S ribosomal protein uL4m n=1 Tax=Dipodascopsis tothii TaxID=44089 RepID=UPI0034CDDC5A
MAALRTVLPRAARPPAQVYTTLHSFPALEPRTVAAAPANLLQLPVRRDLLWRAVVFENDADRALVRRSRFVPDRAQVGYSTAKIRPQKGTGRARLGSRGSPMLVGGGKPFGPRHPDESTELPAKIHSLALRTALSYAYARGSLVVVDGPLDLPSHKTRALTAFADVNHWDADGYLFVVDRAVDEPARPSFLERALGRLKPDSRVAARDDVDVRDILRARTIFIEKPALDWIDTATEV